MAIDVRIAPFPQSYNHDNDNKTENDISWHPEDHTIPIAPPTRPFFWETAQLCHGYRIANVVFLPSLSLFSQPEETNGPESSSKSSLSFRRLVQAFTRSGFDLAGTDTYSTSSVLLFTVVLPCTNGYVNRSDFFQLRLQDCPHLTRFHEQMRPLEYYQAIKPQSDLPDLVENAPAMIQWANLDSSVSIVKLRDTMCQRVQELRARLNGAPFLSPEPIERKRVALIRGRPNITTGGPVYRTAEALGLDLVIVDEEGHWLQQDTPENRKHREAFLITDMTEDEGVVDRIIHSIKGYHLPIHGVFTLSDNFFVAVARVAEALDLPTSPVSAFETSVDKYRSRLTQDTPGHTARVSSVQELDALLTPPTLDDKRPDFTPNYPMIVKPTKGWSSECVSKVANTEDLFLAVEKATKRHGSAAVIEPFFDGPEIDVNFILLDGEILFCDIADEPPCDADAANATVNDTFSPEALTIPSVLPAEEQEIAKSTLRDILVRLGFRTGVFHVEARMINSAREYRHITSGIVDLVPKKSRPAGAPVCRLLEINARPAGYRVTLPLKQTYGVDYFAAHMLAAVAQHSRLKLVAHPFDHESVDGRTLGAQYRSRLVYIPAPVAGVIRWRSGLSPCEELKRRCPHLANDIVLATDYFQPGDRVEPFTDGARTYVAHLLVRQSHRLHTIWVANMVRSCFQIDIEAE